MTVQTTTNVATGIGNDVTTVFPVGYKFNDDADLVVLRIDDATSAAETLTLNSDYTVQGAGNEAGGSVTMSAPLAVGKTLTITRIVDILQLTDLRNQGKFFAEVHEDSFDKFIMIMQQLFQAVGDSLQLNAARNRWDAKGRRIINVGDPVDAQDAVTKSWLEAYIAALLQTSIGPVQTAASVIIVAPNGDVFTLQDLANPAKGAAIVGSVTPQGVEKTVAERLDRAEVGAIGAASLCTGKMIVRRAQYTAGIGTVGSRYWVVQGKSTQRGGHVLMEMRRGVTTTTGSMGGDAELLRVTSVLNLASAWIGRHSYTSVSDPAHWSESVYTPAGASVFYEHGEEVRKYWSIVGAGATRWIEFNVPFNSEGKANIQFYATPASAPDAEIHIDGVLFKTLSLAAPSAAIFRLELTGAAGYHTVRVSQGASAGLINVFGSNYGEVRDYPDFANPSGFVGFGDGAAWTSGEGANDYAIQDAASGLFGGSFHGGETLVSESFVIDGAPANPMASITPCKTISINQRTLIDWSSEGGPSIGVLSTHEFAGAAGYGFRAAFDGSVSALSFYTAMHTTPTTFTDVTFPGYIDLASAPDGFKVLPRSPLVAQEDPSTGRGVETTVGLAHIDDANPYGGVTIRKVSGSYNKLYYGPVIGASSGVYVQRATASFSKRFY